MAVVHTGLKNITGTDGEESGGPKHHRPKKKARGMEARFREGLIYPKTAPFNELYDWLRPRVEAEKNSEPPKDP